jgi:hypothetical protein
MGICLFYRSMRLPGPREFPPIALVSGSLLTTQRPPHQIRPLEPPPELGHRPQLSTPPPLNDLRPARRSREVARRRRHQPLLPTIQRVEHRLLGTRHELCSGNSGPAVCLAAILCYNWSRRGDGETAGPSGLGLVAILPIVIERVSERAV